jgi:hypothetical protein
MESESSRHRRVWDDEAIEKIVLSFSKQMLSMERELMYQKAAVTALKSYVATRLNPDDPKEVFDLLRRMAQNLSIPIQLFKQNKKPLK